MDSFSSRNFHAVEAVLYIALHAGTEPIRSREICEYQKVAVRYLEPLLQRLVKAKILRGVRGPKGGYLLARERRKITVGEIIEAVCILKCNPEQEEAKLRKYITAPLWSESRAIIMERYHNITLADLCQKAQANGIAIETAKKGDFNI